MERLIRYGKKVTLAIVMIFVVAVTGILSTSFDSNAAELSVSVPYSRPYCDDRNGYISLGTMVNGYSSAWTYVWSFMPNASVTENGTARTEFEMILSFTSNSIKMQPYSVGSGGGWLTLGQYDYDGNFSILWYGQIGLNEWTTTQTFGSGIYSIEYGGSVDINGSYDFGNSLLIHWNNSVDATQMNDLLYRILNTMNNVDVDTSQIIQWLDWTYYEIDNVEEQLTELEKILDYLVKEQEKSNTWLGKIWDSIQEFINPSDNDSQKTDKFNNESNSQKNEIDELNNQNQVEKVDVDSAALQVDSNINYDNMAEYGGVLATITNNEYILQLILVVVSVVIISYVLFGKR